MSNERLTSSRPTLHLIGGLPGSGKSTLARHLLTESAAVFLCPDAGLAALHIDLKDSLSRTRMEAQLIVRSGQLLSQGHNVILELALWKREERDELRKMAEQQGAQVRLSFLDVPFDQLTQRIQERNKSRSRSIGHVSIEELELWSKQVQVPSDEELALFSAGSVLNPQRQGTANLGFDVVEAVGAEGY